jgi:hypothetical protein
MEAVFIGELTEDTFSLRRLLGSWPGVSEGTSFARTRSFCHRMLAGAPNATHDAGNDPAYRDTPARTEYGITSYVGVPIVDHAGTLLGTLCGIDRGSVRVPDSALTALRGLATFVGSHLSPPPGAPVMIWRTDAGWAVTGGDELDDLTTAMALADLIAGRPEPRRRPPRPEGELDESAQLRLSVIQLEHALVARVVVEQAIGVLAERHHVAPRVAFERLRKAARSRGRKVHDLAREVVASAADRGVPLPLELAPRR